MVESPSNETLESAKPARIANTGGESLFDAGAYYGINYAGNTAVSIYLTDKAFNRQEGMFGFWEWLHDNRINVENTLQDFAKNFLKDPKQRADFEKAFEEKIGELNNKALFAEWEKSGESFGKMAKHLSEELGHEITPQSLRQIRDYVVQTEANAAGMRSLASIVMLCTGGFLTLIPVKLLEDQKIPIVKFLDKQVVDKFLAVSGKAPKTDEEKEALQAQREQRYEQIKHEPKQTWMSEIASRICAILPIYAVHMVTAGDYNILKTGGARLAGTEYVNPSKTVGFAGFSHYLDNAGEWLGNAVLEHKPSIANMFKDEETFKQHATWLASDSCYTWLSATFTYMGTRILGPILGKKEELPQEQEVGTGSTPGAQIHVGSSQGKIAQPGRALASA